MFIVLIVGLISGPGSVGASLAECSMSRMKFTREESRKSGLRSVSKSSWETLSVTSRRGISRRDVKNHTSLTRRDVDSHVATSK